jgi:hypothetical protein
LFEEKRNAPLLVRDYFDSVIESLDLFKITGEVNSHEQLEEKLLQSIEQMRPLRDDIVTFITNYQRHTLELDMERVHAFFEKLLNYIENIRHEDYLTNINKDIKADNFNFFGHELFMYVCSAMLRAERFKELHYLLHNDFIVTDRHHDRTNALGYNRFRRHLMSLDENRNKRLGLNRKSVTADLLNQRAGNPFSFEELKETDALLYYISIMKKDMARSVYNWWWPITAAYEIWNLKFMQKAMSTRFFNKVKYLFGVETIDQLREIVITAVPVDQQFSRFDYSLPMIQDGLHMKDLCQIP